MISDYPIRIEAIPGTVVIQVAGTEIVRCDSALGLKEYIYPEVAFVPISAVDPNLLLESAYFKKSDKKGHARFWHINVNDYFAENAVYGYDDPLPAIEALKGYIAFQRDRVDFIQIEPAVSANS